MRARRQALPVLKEHAQSDQINVRVGSEGICKGWVLSAIKNPREKRNVSSCDTLDIRDLRPYSQPMEPFGALAVWKTWSPLRETFHPEPVLVPEEEEQEALGR